MDMNNPLPVIRNQMKRVIEQSSRVAGNPFPGNEDKNLTRFMGRMREVRVLVELCGRMDFLSLILPRKGAKNSLRLCVRFGSIVQVLALFPILGFIEFLQKVQRLVLLDARTGDRG